jgi:hypothetical protein
MIEERRDSDIDKHRLDEELIKQVRLYDKWAEKLARAKNSHAECIDERALVESELDELIRKDPEKFGLAKVTEPAVEKAIILNQRYQEALRAERKAQSHVNIYQYKINTLEHRKKSLEGLVQLLLNHYYSDVRIPKGTEEEREAKRAMETRAIRRRSQK